MRKATSHGGKADEESSVLEHDLGDQPCSKKVRHKKRQLRHVEGSSSKMGHDDDEEPFCPLHREPIKFMCVAKLCLRELCSHCILEHQVHIHHIKTIAAVLEDAKKFYQRFDPKGAEQTLLSNQKANVREIDSIMSDILNNFKQKISALQKSILSQDKKLVENVCSKESFLANSKDIAQKKLPLDSHQLAMVQSFLRSDGIRENPALRIEVDHFISKCSDVFDDCVKITKNGVSYESTEPHVPKLLHWFEWSKKKLYLYDVVKNCTRIVDLQINFKLPSYSRSIITPTGHIYLMGGEEPEMTTRDDVYVYDCNVENNDMLEIRKKMLCKKYDFTMCVMNGFIYVISGRDSSSEIIDRCEKYDYVKDQWHLAAPVNKKRYAAACASIPASKKIYLFGGRSDNNNLMHQDVEEYDAVKDEWKVIELKDPRVWVPVEVAAMIQVDENKLLIFGGSEANVTDTNSSYIFNTSEFVLEKNTDMKRAQVFVAAPVLFGNFVYSIGNEYYVKTRSLNKYNIEKREWSIIL